MNTEIMKQVFENLPNRVKAGLKSIHRNPGPETELWLHEPIPALGDKSIVQVLADAEDGEAAIIAYCNAVKGKFF